MHPGGLDTEARNTPKVLVTINQADDDPIEEYDNPNPKLGLTP